MEFYVFINDSQQGPFTLDQLASLDITPETEVWTEGMDDWKQAGDVPALTSLLQQQEYRRARAAQASQAVPPTTRLNQPHAPEAAYERTYAEPAAPARSEKRGGGCLLWSLVVAFVLLIVLVVTVPSREDHLNTIKDVTREWMTSTLDDNGVGGMLGEVTKWVGGSGIDLIFDQIFSYDNYFVCSVGTFNYGTHSKHVSFGILGHVFTFAKEDINNTIKQAIPGHDEPVVEVAPEVEEQPQESYDEPQAPVQDEDEDVAPADGKSSAAQELLDSIASRAKREAVKAAKEWAKKKIDEM